MSTAKTATSRRAFLKTGALAAAPLAVLAPGAALAADDGSKARLARLEDERAIDALHRQALREVNAGNGAKLAPGLATLADAPHAEPAIAFSDDGLRASARRACTAGFTTDFTGNSTIEQMARLQGQGSHAHSEARVLVAKYVKGKDGWAIEGLRLA